MYAQKNSFFKKDISVQPEKAKNRTIAYILGGTLIEHMDNVLFSLYLPILSGFFFGVNDLKTQWFLGLIAFSIYALFRPIGSFLMGIVGDRYGRRTALIGSVALMSLATMGLGLLPSYAAWGLFASALFILLRIMQGLSVGGEYATAMTYIFETTPSNRQIVNGGILIASTHVGGALAALLSYFYPDHFQIIFLGAGFIGIVSLFGRLSLVETMKSSGTFSLKQYRLGSKEKTSIRAYAQVAFASSCLVFCFWTLTIYCNKILQQNFSVPMQNIFFINFLLLSFWVVAAPGIGYWADRRGISFSALSRTGALLMMVCAVPLFAYVHFLHSVFAFVCVQLILSFFHVIFCVSTPKMMCRLFADRVRNTHVGLSYSLGSCITGVLMPILNGFAFEHMGLVGIGSLLVLFSGLGFYAFCGQKDVS